MSVALYMDVHVPLAITTSLRLKGIRVVTAQQDGADQLDDSLLLDRATELGCVLVTQDKDLLSEARHRQAAGVEFCGLVFAPQLRTTIGQCVEDLELIALCSDRADWLARVEFLPLK